MTDNDDPVSPRHVSSSFGRDKEEPRQDAARPTEEHGARATRRIDAAGHIAPTDPEVPSAKRRGALQRQRSLVGLAAVVVGLLSITFSVLYRASQRVGAAKAMSDDAPFASNTARIDARSFPPGTSRESAPKGLRPSPPLQPGSELDDDDDAPASDRGSSDSAAANSATPPSKAPPPAHGIIRTPAF